MLAALKYLIIGTFILCYHSTSYSQNLKKYCDITNKVRNRILFEIKNNNPKALSDLPNCFKLDRKLILKASVIDPAQFQYADPILRQDEIFVNRLLKYDPSILQYAHPNLLNNANFIKKATYISRDSLQYASDKLRDNKIFIGKMIDIDSRNYKFASKRLQAIENFAEMAFEDNGLLLQYAPDNIKSNKKLVAIAFKSNKNSIKYAAKNLQKLKEFKFKEIKEPKINKDDLEKFIIKNYLTKSEGKHIDQFIISNKAKFFNNNKLIDRNYITKWQKDHKTNLLHLIRVDSRNYQNFWKDDFKNYPKLIKKIEHFFIKRNTDINTVDNLSTTYLWQVKDKPLTLAFNLYLLRDNPDEDLGPNFSDITSLTAIVQKRDNKWHMTVIEVIFGSETKMSANYKNGHRRYILWDLSTVSKSDNKPKLIFKVEDNLEEYFEIYREESGGKYQFLYKIEQP